jgi:hypothetical protein
MRTCGGFWLGLGLLLAAGSVSQAYFLDKERNFDVRLRTYSQLGILTDSSSFDGPEYDAGDLAQHRNFYNPELDAKLTDRLHGVLGRVPALSFLDPDEFKFRFAWWGFYDGVYDYLDPRWNDHRRDLRARVSETDNPERESLFFNDENKNPRHIYASRNRINEMYLDWTKGRFFFRVGRQAISWGESDTIALLDVSNPFDLTLGAPGFFQDVDEARIPLWTARSTVKLIDNWRWLSSLFADAYLVPGPIDTTVPINPIVGGVTPFGPDVRDPQEQVDAANNDTLVRTGLGGPCSSLPGGCRLQILTVDRLPSNDWGNSRWGARLTGVLFRDYTVQGWFFRTFNTAPVPLLVSPGPSDRLASGFKPILTDNRGFRVPVCNNISPSTGLGTTPAGRPCQRSVPVLSILERRLESVVGIAATWYNQPLNGIIRAEAEYFIDELAFRPEQNLNARSQLPRTGGAAALVDRDPITGKLHPDSTIPKADYLRFQLGYDRFFFLRALNPANSFVLVMAFNGSINMTERDGMDFRNPNPKPGKGAAVVRPIPGSPICTPANVRNPSYPASLKQLCVVTPPQNFEDAKKFEGFLTTALQTDYMHGKLTPRLVIITDVSGIFGFAPTATYRFTDSFLGTVSFLAIEGSRKAGLATFREHDMVQLRFTYQLN